MGSTFVIPSWSSGASPSDWIVDVDSPERAYEIAAAAAPGPGDAPLNMAIEVRQVMSGLPID